MELQNYQVTELSSGEKSICNGGLWKEIISVALWIADNWSDIKSGYKDGAEAIQD